MTEVKPQYKKKVDTKKIIQNNKQMLVFYYSYFIIEFSIL